MHGAKYSVARILSCFGCQASLLIGHLVPLTLILSMKDSTVMKPRLCYVFHLFNHMIYNKWYGYCIEYLPKDF